MYTVTLAMVPSANAHLARYTVSPSPSSTAEENPPRSNERTVMANGLDLVALRCRGALENALILALPMATKTKSSGKLVTGTGQQSCQKQREKVRSRELASPNFSLDASLLAVF
ncbi:hypothetical protein E2562_039026 [Oryza meyeriana var. granulata]|uniref:Uncharacterized protein n=1 Tax=Oryza meyeriana var. granulata TaxID=110450 RepID=A0A6G1CMA5_9ORYZ|nr:hypothetical protein E2562_039026 [Oryza meyeriana var. granulata]